MPKGLTIGLMSRSVVLKVGTTVLMGGNGVLKGNSIVLMGRTVVLKDSSVVLKRLEKFFTTDRTVFACG